jgi:hypothetical protein
MVNPSKRRGRPSESKKAHKPIDNEWEKEDEELELESQLFGKSKKQKREKAGPSKVAKKEEDEDVAGSDEDMDDVSIAAGDEAKLMR